MIERIADGRTDLVFLCIGGDVPPPGDAHDLALLMSHCAYYGDVSAIRHLLAHGATLPMLGADLGLNAAAFHGHWRLCEFLLEQGAEVDAVLPATGETALHSACSAGDGLAHERVVEVLLAHGADTARVTLPDAPTGAYMRDARTRAETALHRAAAGAGAGTVALLLAAGARVDARDAHGDTPLAWASWHRRPDAILRLLCFGSHAIRPDRRPMAENLLGVPHGGRPPSIRADPRSRS